MERLLLSAQTILISLTGDTTHHTSKPKVFVKRTTHALCLAFAIALSYGLVLYELSARAASCMPEMPR